MRKIPFLFFALLLTACFIGCENEEYDNVYVEMTTDVVPTEVPTLDSSSTHKYKIMYGGQSYRIGIRAVEVSKGQLSRVLLSTFDRERREVVVLDTAVTGSLATAQLIYQAPENLSSDTLPLNFIVVAYNVAGESCRREYAFTLVQQDAPLTAMQGITLYAQEGDEHPNAFSFSRMLPIRSSLSDSSEVSLYVSRNAENPDVMTREWRTMNGTYFIKNNSFDYARATRKTVTSAYRSSVSYHIVNNLNTDDVILVGDEDKAIGVIKIQAIYDDEGSGTDRYYFDFKPISQK